MSCPGALCQAPTLSVLGPDALCFGARRSRALYVRSRRSLCRGPALFPHSLCCGPAFSESEPGALSLSVSGPGGLCRATRRSLTRVGARRSLCVGPRRSLCPGPALFVCRATALSVSGPGALCVRARQSLCRAPAFLCRGKSKRPPINPPFSIRKRRDARPARTIACGVA